MFYIVRLIKLAFSNLLIRKFNSFLTILGITFGSGAFLATLSSNEGALAHIKEQLDKMGTKLIWIIPKQNNKIHLNESDRDYLLKFSQYIDKISLYYRFRGNHVRYKSKVQSIDFFGVDPNYFSNTLLPLKKGRIFDNFENDHKYLVGVLGGKLAENLFGKHIPLDQFVYLFTGKIHIPVRIIGVLKSKGGVNGEEVDGALYIPAQTSLKITTADKLNPLMVTSLKDDRSSQLAKKQFEVLLKSKFTSGIDIFDAREAIEQTNLIWEKQNTVGICLAFISLITGGIGIMNVMLLSINQRRREIGLCKALGAKRVFILFQFLFEAVIICLSGGLVGIIIGAVFGKYVARLMGQWQAVTSLGNILFSLFFCILIGITFGLLPAYRASKLDPYVALRS